MTVTVLEVETGPEESVRFPISKNDIEIIKFCVKEHYPMHFHHMPKSDYKEEQARLKMDTIFAGDDFAC